MIHRSPFLAFPTIFFKRIRYNGEEQRIAVRSFDGYFISQKRMYCLGHI